MKSKILTLFLIFIVLVLLIGMGYIAFAIYMDFSGKDPKSSIYTLQNIAVEQPEEKETSNITIDNTKPIDTEVAKTSEITIKNDILSNSLYFYNQLTDTQKIIYNGLSNYKQNLKEGNYVIKYGDAFSDLLSQEDGSNILGDDYQAAVEAFTHDNPDLFYIDVNKMYLNIESSTRFFRTKYNVYISPKAGENYLSDEFQSVTMIEIAINQIEMEKDKIIKQLNSTDYKNILYIHDYLVNNIEYDTTYEGKGGYTIYGALVEKKCTCEGYAKAFKYLLNSAGYECELMQGTATNSSGQTENHAWNCVNYNSIWYEVDVTWDDPIIVGNGSISNLSKHRYFMKGTETFNKDHNLSYQFSEKGRRFSYPNISTNDF